MTSFCTKALIAGSIVLMSVLVSYSQKPTPTPAEPSFLMAIEDVFYINGRGTFVTGKVERGRLKVGDKVDIVGLRPMQTTTVTAVEMFRKLLTEAETGANVGLLLKGLQKTDVERGQVLAKPGTVKSYLKLKAKIDLIPTADGGRKTAIANGYRPQIYIRTGSFSGVFTLPAGKKEVLPGEKGIVVDIVLDKEAALDKGLVITLREGGRTIGSGVVTAVIK